MTFPQDWPLADLTHFVRTVPLLIRIARDSGRDDDVRLLDQRRSMAKCELAKRVREAPLVKLGQGDYKTTIGGAA